MSAQEKLLDYIAAPTDTLICCEHRTVKYAERARVLFSGVWGPRRVAQTRGVL